MKSMTDTAAKSVSTLLACMIVAACGGGGDPPSDPPPTPDPNVAPTANAGPDQSVSAAALVQLSGAASADADGSIASYTWMQTGGPTVVLSNASVVAPTFQAPALAFASTVTFSLSVVDNRGAASPVTDFVAVMVQAAPNQAPIANAGPDQTVASGAIVQLSGAASTDVDGSIAAYAWTQASGPAVTLSNAAIVAPTFPAPIVLSATTLTFSLGVTDNLGAASAATDSISIIVQPPGAGMVTVSGRWTFARIPMVTTTNAALDYNATRQDPARGITVQAINSTTSAVLATASTNASGDYALSVPANTNVRIRALAQMTRVAPLPLPHWQFRVRDVDGSVDYAVDGPVINSGATGTTQNIGIASGWPPGTVGPRLAAPFAILDTVYTAMNAVLAVVPTASFPILTLDWATTNTGGVTFYQGDGGADTRVIVIAGQADNDTDEYDQHVVAHEFGHYLEDRFARSDSLGGPHTVGDRLDPTVAFGEGFGTAFAAIALNDPQYRDTRGAGQASGLSFSVEPNSQVNPGWYSEGSSYSILWDLFDSAADGNDNLALGFAPIWQVLTGAQRTTDAITSMFSFATVLKQQNSAQATQIDAIVSGQSIVSSTIDIYGSTETNSAASANVLPVFTPISIGGGAQTITSIGSFGLRKLSVVRYLRLSVAAPQSARITVTGSRDVDALVLGQGVEVATADAAGNENFVVNLVVGNYVIAVYDYANLVGGPAANTPITVTITSN